EGADERYAHPGQPTSPHHRRFPDRRTGRPTGPTAAPRHPPPWLPATGSAWLVRWSSETRLRRLPTRAIPELRPVARAHVGNGPPPPPRPCVPTVPRSVQGHRARRPRPQCPVPG